MSQKDKIEFAFDQIAHYISDGLWMVPKYQRGYKWEEKQVKDLFDDLDLALKDKADEYFLGTLVAAKNAGSRPEIVDGQQRLATVTILIAAIRDYLIETLDDPKKASKLESKYLADEDIYTNICEPRLKLSDIDNDFFQTKIIAPPSDSRRELLGKRESHRRIEAAQQQAQEYVKKVAAASSDKADALLDRVRFLDERVKVISLLVPDHQNAFTLFETLNDRGIGLAITDLLKNFLFHRAGDRISEVQQRWVEMITTVETAADEDSIKEYVRHQWSSSHGLTRERELFKAIKESLGSKAAVVNYSESLRKEALLYAAIRNDSQDFWKSYGTGAKQDITTITHTLGMERITPLLLAVFSKFVQREVEKTLKMIVSWGVRFIIAGSVAGQLEKLYSAAAVKIRNGAITTAAQLYKDMKTEIPSDLLFQSKCSTAKVSKASLARYYLRTLEKQKANLAVIANPDEMEVNLEHVLPQKRKPGTWTAFSDEEVAEYCYRLGNLALMISAENNTVGTEEFSSKAKIYVASSLKLTKEIGAESVWTRGQIESRQNALAKLAVKAWPAKG